MQPVTIIDTLEGIEQHAIHSCILLYSGGTDGLYFLDWARQKQVEVITLTVGLDQQIDYQSISKVPQALGIKHVFQNRTDEFLDKYVLPAIHANAYYQGNYPICSSLSRPLMIKAAVELAHELGIKAIVHTSNYNQNSAARFNFSLIALDPSLTIIAPFLRSHHTRDEKLVQLKRSHLPSETSIYSIDSNIWGRVIEGGTLENPENDLPETGIFSWTRDVDQAMNSAETVEIEFKHGSPIAINGRRSSLQDTITYLNDLGGVHSIGRFSGLEEITFGVKNHEIREAPAAHILITAHRELEAALFSQAELSLKYYLDSQWTNLVVAGYWYSHLVKAISAFIEEMNRLVSGKVKMKLYKGNLTCARKQAYQGLYYTQFHEPFSSLMNDVSYASVYNFMATSLLQRNQQPSPGEEL